MEAYYRLIQTTVNKFLLDFPEILPYTDFAEVIWL